MKLPRRKILKKSRAATLHWWDFTLACGHVWHTCCPTDRQLASGSTTCEDCYHGYCKEGQHHFVDAEGPESAAFKCTKCPYTGRG